MIEVTLTEIENWYREPGAAPDRPKLLSKLAVLELSGWIEEWMDGLVRQIDERTLRDQKWLASEVLDKTSGFHYHKHLRKMLCSVMGEFEIRRVERDFEAAHPGLLDDIISDLGSLWDQRCKLAHADLAAHKSAQLVIQAPSWTKNRFRIISKRLQKFEDFIIARLPPTPSG